MTERLPLLLFCPFTRFTINYKIKINIIEKQLEKHLDVFIVLMLPVKKDVLRVLISKHLFTTLKNEIGMEPLKPF